MYLYFQIISFTSTKGMIYGVGE